MRSNPWLSIAGAYRYDNEILTQITLPSKPTIAYDGYISENYPVLSTEYLIYRILTECGDLELLYTDMDFLKAIIGAWATSSFPIWQRLYNTLCFEYNPLWNRHKWVDSTTDDALAQNFVSNRDTNSSSNTNTTDATTGSSEGSTSGAESTTGTTSGTTGNSGTTETLVAGYNSEEYVHQSKVIADGTGTSGQNSTGSSNSSGSSKGTSEENSTGTEATTGTVNTDYNSDTTGTKNKVYKYEEKGQGGIYTALSAGELLEKERESVQFDIYDYITADFKKRFCLLVY